VSFAEASGLVLNKHHSESDIALWCGIFVIIGVWDVIASYFRVYFMNLFGAKLTQVLRERLFAFILRQPASWFDVRNGNQGACYS
jgi:ABC-type multidrug transport system fused ATPase/permease subunit